MPGLVPGIHVLKPSKIKGVDGRDKPGHDDGRLRPSTLGLYLSAAPGVLPCRSLPAFATLSVILALIGPAAAQDRRVPTGAELKLSFAPIVQRVAPAVVNVYAAKVVENRNPLFDDPLFRRFFGSPDMPRDRVQRSLGSGVIVDPSGLVVTNNHVIEGASEVKVALADKREFEAEHRAQGSRAPISRCCASRTSASAFRRSSSAIPTTCRWATWCSPSATRSRSARP